MIKVKIAIPLFNNRIAPRFGCTKEIAFIEINNNEIIKEDIIDVSNLRPDSLPVKFAELKIEAVICGGINKNFQQMLHENGIKLIWGIIGDYKEVIKLYLNNQLQSNEDFCYRGRNGRGCRHRAGSK